MESDRLLDDLAKLCDCYISTLKSYQFSQLMIYFTKIYPNNYKLEEWNYCFSYIFETKIEFLSCEEIKEFLQTPDKKMML